MVAGIATVQIKMSDQNTTIQEIRDWVRTFQEKRGWTRRQNAKNFAISLVLEAIELLEHYQWYEGKEIEADKVRKQEVRYELVDVLYWVVTLADVYGMDLSETLGQKLKIGEKRYPADKFSKDLPKAEVLKRYYTLKQEWRKNGH